MAGLNGRFITKLASGYAHTLVLLNTGEVLACGWAIYGQTGSASSVNRSIPTKVEGLEPIADIACGGDHSMMVTKSGKLLVCGFNRPNILGLGVASEAISVPTLVKGLDGVVSVACDVSHAIALLDSGELATWGLNELGQLGTGDIAPRSTPEKMVVPAWEGKKVVHVSCYGSHSFAVLASGEVYAWGYNSNGQLGLGDTVNRLVPEKVKALDGHKVISISCGAINTMAILDDGDVYSWGFLTAYETILPTIEEALKGKRIVAIASGMRHTIALDDTGDLFGLGWDDMNQIGPGGFPAKMGHFPGCMQLACGWYHSMILMRCREVDVIIILFF